MDTSEKLDQLLQRQRRLEAEAVGQGRERFERRLEAAQEQGRGATFGAAKRLLSDGTARMVPAVEAWLAEQDGPGRPHAALEWIQQSGAEQASYLTMLTVLHNIYSKVDATKVAREITDRIHLEYRARRLESEAPGLFNYRVEKLRKSTSLRHMKFSLAQTTDYAGVEVETPTEYQRVQVGMLLLDVARLATGLFTFENERKKHGRSFKTTTYLVPTEDTAEWLDKHNEILAAASQQFGPMVVPPLDWGRHEPGGYLYALREVVPLVSTWDREQSERVLEADMPVVYRALNTLQRTPWRINRRIYGVLRQIMERGGGEYDPSARVLVDRASVPAMAPVPMPPEPATDDEEEWRLWRREASYRKEIENTQRKERVRSFWYTMSVARKHLKDNAIFFVWSCDFRGRMYPVTDSGLTPQGSDLSRGLLEFYEGVPLGSQEAVDALALHGATCLDEWEGQKVGTMTRRERIDLIRRLGGRIVDCAADPLGHRWWEEADKPLMFLAFCFEWAGYVADGVDHVSHLPVHVDGSCNGVQHMAAMVRDVETAREVNVTANARPADLYDKMADHANETLAMLAVDPDDELRAWIAREWVESGAVDRKACKRPTMTFGYGGTQYGYTDQIREHYRDEGLAPRLAERFTQEDSERSSLGLAYVILARVLYEGMSEVVPGAFRVREWLQHLASDVIESGADAIEWTVPGTEFPVSQRYNETDTVDVRTTLCGGVRLKRDIAVPNSKPSVRQHVNGIAPNYVHSLDAAHLALTVDMAGLDAVNAIHDSYGCHAAHMPSLEAALRAAFIRLYSDDVLARLVEDVGSSRATPEYGALDLGEVRASQYFFV